MLETEYAVFSGRSYYAYPGWRDFKGTFGLLDHAIAWGKHQCSEASVPEEDDQYDADRYEADDWFHVVDLKTKDVVARGGDGYRGNFEDLPDLLETNGE